jgi:hypothetical protein
VRALERGAWIQHFVAEHYEGEWDVLPLRAPATAVHPVQTIYPDPACDTWVDTPLLAVTPYLASVLAAFQCPLQAVRLMRLGPGSVIKRHRDHDLDVEHGRARLHIPIATNPEVDFELNGARVVLAEGECWYLRLSDPHAVANRGATDRVHLVIDAIVSPWLHEQLARAQEVTDASPHSAPVASEPREPASDRRPALPDWVPIGIDAGAPGPLVEWCDLGGAAFAHPFFTQTIEQARKEPHSTTTVWTPVDVLIAQASAHPGIAPAAFIFHTSRCGSTLVSQLARALPRTVVISEAPPIDELIRAAAPRAERIAWLRALIGALGQPRRAGDRLFFVKFDAWHVLDVPLVQEAFPAVPCVFIYREPAEVIASQMRMPGSYLLPGALDASIAGLSAAEATAAGREEYCARVLRRIYSTGAELAAEGRLSLLNYGEFPEAAIARVLDWAGLSNDPDARRVLADVALLDAKTPVMPYDGESAARRAPSRRASEAAERFVRRAFDDLESLRTSHVSR